jgi:RNA polymerase sigma-70 factor, ECF subfamily
VDLQELSPNDLARLCAEQGSAEAWQEFVRRFTQPISLSVLRVARLWGISSSSVVDDIVQEVFLKLCENNRKVLRDFVPRQPGSFQAFIRIVAASIANDAFRRKKTAKRGGGLEEEVISDLQPGVLHNSEWIERNLLLNEIDRLLAANANATTGKRDRTVFWLYYQQGMTAGDISSLPGISLSVKGVESALHRMTTLIRSHLRTPVTTPAQKNPSMNEGFSGAATVPKSEWQ